MKTPDRMLAAPVDVQGDIDERVREFLLLLELSSNEGIAHYFAEGILQFWIRPDDLAAPTITATRLTPAAMISAIIQKPESSQGNRRRMRPIKMYATSIYRIPKLTITAASATRSRSELC